MYNRTREKLKDAIGAMMDDFMTNTHFQLLLDCPEGTQDVVVADATIDVATINFFFLLQAAKSVMLKMAKEMQIDNDGLREVLTNMTELLLNSCLSELEKGDGR